MFRSLLLVFLVNCAWLEPASIKTPLHETFNIPAKKITLKNFPEAFNPAITKTDRGILLSFRYFPDKKRKWISQCAMVLLNDYLVPISQPQIIPFRDTDPYPPYFEDCRLFHFGDKIYALYSDCTDFEYPADIEYNPFISCKEYLHLSEITINKDLTFTASPPLKLIYPAKKESQQRQKNWIPFEWNGKLYFSYYLFPHEVLEPNLETGECTQAYLTNSHHPWRFGEIRGTTPSQLVDGEYLAFFHSSIFAKSPVSPSPTLHYFIGAYTFSAEPPFEITKISPKPIISQGMYTNKPSHFHVVFPCGYLISGDNIYLSYGKNDIEMWIAKISKSVLLNTLVPVTNYN